LETESPVKQNPNSTKTVLDSKASEDTISPSKPERASNQKASKNMGTIMEEAPSPSSLGKKS
jgi:hypothetical protein